MKDIELLKQLEKETGRPLKQIPINQMESFLASGSYSLDFNNNCIAVNLSQFSLNQIPATLFQMMNLQEVYLQYNNIQQVPAEISNWKFINKLNLNDNKISHLPKTILDLNLEISYYLKPLPRAIFLNKNPLIYPPLNIVEQGSFAIKHFFENSSTPPPIEKKEIKVEYTGNKDLDDLQLIDKILAEPVIENTVKTIPPPPPIIQDTTNNQETVIISEENKTQETTNDLPELTEKIAENTGQQDVTSMPELKTVINKNDEIQK